MRSRILAFAVVLICSASGRAGGPAFVAGSGYDPGVEGQPLVWANGFLQYHTDQGSLSPLLSGTQADAFVAAAFSVWTSIPGVALNASNAGQLAEDVTGNNIQINGEGVVTAPADISPSATGTSIGIVYDTDGTVTNALLGEGAGDVRDCFTNAVYGGPDNFSSAGNIVHALVIINGICAATSDQLPDVQYRLVRVLGRTAGLGWSQANLNVLTRNPPPTSEDFAGFPVMHFRDPISCVPISICYPNPALPSLDDIDALTRLYPGSGNPQPSGRVYGSVYFTDNSGNAVQPMQGVNVVARLLVSGVPSRQFVVTSVSGFLFSGNAGNIIDGYVDGRGLPYNRRGSSDPALEGFFDLGQLIIPLGQSTAQYQLSVEAVDAKWSFGMEPYVPTQVQPSGTFAPVVVTVATGSNAERDILMVQNEVAQTHPGSGSTYASPSPLPQGGSWGSWISGYGSADFFEFTAQAKRTASVAVIALDEAGQPSETKLLPVIGIWELSDQSGNPAPASTASAFNSTTFAMTRLDAQFGVSEKFRVAVADFRGDGRPDYFYQAKLLYSDTVTPARLSLAGGVTTLNGLGFSPVLQVKVDGNSGNTLSATASHLQAAIPAGLQDGVATIQVTDPASGAFSQMIGALSYGASATDQLLLLQAAEPATAVGSVADKAIRVRAVAADGLTPVNGATIAWSSTNGLQFSACGGTSSCSVLSDEAGESSSLVTPMATGQSAITIALAPVSYSPPQSQHATLVGTASTLDLAALMPTLWLGQGATLSVPLTVEALDLGAPIPNLPINFILTQGSATLSAGSAITNLSGFASITATIANLSANVLVSACVAPTNSPCRTFTLFSTPSSLWRLALVAGSSQVVPAGQAFQPLVLRVTDGSDAANPVMGVSVNFETTRARAPVFLGSSQAQVLSLPDGSVSIVPSAGSVGPCAVFITISAGSSTVQLQMESLPPLVIGQPVKFPHKAPPALSEPRLVAPLAASPGMPDRLFAVPQGDPNTEPAVDPRGSDCSADDASGRQRAPASASPAGNESAISPPCASKPAEAPDSNKGPEEDPNPDSGNVPRLESAVASASAPNPARAQTKTPTNPASSGWLPVDKRSCRVLAGDGMLP